LQLKGSALDASSLIRALRDKPYDLLVALDRRGRASTASPGEDANPDREWVGVAWRMAGEAYLVAREEMREVLTYPGQLTRVPGAKSWVKGLANVRGALLPIIDLRQYLGSGATPLTRNTRLLVVNHRDVPAGLMVDEVLGFRRFTDGEFGSNAPPTIVRCERYIAGAFRRGAEAWPVLSLRLLVENPGFLDAAA
jgi:twitching motility protein PilI